MNTWTLRRSRLFDINFRRRFLSSSIIIVTGLRFGTISSREVPSSYSKNDRYIRDRYVQVQYRSKPASPHNGTGKPFCHLYQILFLLHLFFQEFLCRSEVAMDLSRVGIVHAKETGVKIETAKRGLVHHNCLPDCSMDLLKRQRP